MGRGNRLTGINHTEFGVEFLMRSRCRQCRLILHWVLDKGSGRPGEAHVVPPAYGDCDLYVHGGPCFGLALSDGP